MAAPDPSFALPAHKLATAGVLPGPNVTVAPSGGQAFALNPDGTIPSILLTGTGTTVTGQVASDGTINAGSGFTVNHSGTGTYVITFTTAFAAAPTVVGLLAEAQASIVKQTAVSASAVTILITSTANAAVDRAFNFVAMATG